MIERGYDPAYIMALDYVSFKLLVDVSDRLDAERKLEQMHLAAVAAQGDTKTMKEAKKPYMERARITAPHSAPENDAKAFAKKYPKGV